MMQKKTSTLLCLSSLLMIFNCSCSIYKKSVESQTIIPIRTTAYTESEKDHLKYRNKTAIGTTLKPGIIATDWSIFPVGTKLKIDDKIYIVEDFGSALVKPIDTVIPTVDVYTISKYKMREWGVRFFDNVEIVEFGCYETSLNILKHRLKYPHCRDMFNRIQEKL